MNECPYYGVSTGFGALATRYIPPSQRAVLPPVRAGALRRTGIDALNKVSAVLTTEKRTELNRRG